MRARARASHCQVELPITALGSFGLLTVFCGIRPGSTRLHRNQMPMITPIPAKQALALQPTNLRRHDFVVELETAVKKAAKP